MTRLAGLNNLAGAIKALFILRISMIVPNGKDEDRARQAESVQPYAALLGEAYARAHVRRVQAAP
jgi:hypothetical protein